MGSPEAEEGVAALGVLQRGLNRGGEDSVSEGSENDDVLVSEGEVNGSAFGKLTASAVEQSKCIWFLKCPVTAPKLIAICWETSEAVRL